MAAKVKPIPDGFHTVTPYLIVDGAKKVIDFMQQALGAKHDHEPTLRPDGTIMHAAVKIGDSMVMVSDASEHAKAMPVMLYLYVPDVDAPISAPSRQAPPRSWSRRINSTAIAAAA
jgi:uncharacterized glyoxalase superfamily protein PhnB